MKLYRPYTPWSVRREVIARQMREAGKEPSFAAKYTGSDQRAVRFMLEELFGGGIPVELHHDPALVNRQWDARKKDYVPRANDPAHLVYLVKDDHEIRTRVRGAHGQHSDLALARKRKRVGRKKNKRKIRWPKRKLQSANRWPKRVKS